MPQAFNPTAQEAGWSESQGQPGLHTESQSQNKNHKTPTTLIFLKWQLTISSTKNHFLTISNKAFQRNEPA